MPQEIKLSVQGVFSKSTSSQEFMSIRDTWESNTNNPHLTEAGILGPQWSEITVLRPQLSW